MSETGTQQQPKPASWKERALAAEKKLEENDATDGPMSEVVQFRVTEGLMKLIQEKAIFDGCGTASEWCRKAVMKYLGIV